MHDFTFIIVQNINLFLIKTKNIKKSVAKEITFYSCLFYYTVSGRLPLNSCCNIKDLFIALTNRTCVRFSLKSNFCFFGFGKMFWFCLYHNIKKSKLQLQCEEDNTIYWYIRKKIIKISLQSGFVYNAIMCMTHFGFSSFKLSVFLHIKKFSEFAAQNQLCALFLSFYLKVQSHITYML